MAGLREFVVQFGTEEQCIEHFAGATYLPVPGVANVRHRGCRRARGCTNARPATGRNRRPLERCFTGREPT
jgi:hypothetical protein